MSADARWTYNPATRTLDVELDDQHYVAEDVSPGQAHAFAEALDRMSEETEAR